MNITQYISYLLIAIGALAFIVSAITQVIKELPHVKNLPTSAVAMVISLILCPVALIAVCQYYDVIITWYIVFASIIAAFIVYLVATGGWEKLKGIWDRTKYSK